MTHQEFEKFYNNECYEEQKLMLSKGEEYCKGNEDRLHNFKDIAKDLSLNSLQTWAVYFKKHIDSIINYVKCGEVKSNESIESRFRDARNYLTLGLALIKEQK